MSVDMCNFDEKLARDRFDNDMNLIQKSAALNYLHPRHDESAFWLSRGLIK